MSEYQVIARRFRPQTFEDVLGQDAIITTLKNAIRYKRLAQSYLFCGSRGTGKTTLARLLAKAINCQQPSENLEPCNLCSSCKDITLGHSLDVLEIDGASHRGIEDIRQINETVGYAASSGGYKIYIIDEVHMLTKEAFNALLKTLEEPPAKVKFFFATTEPHKVPATILSRCQRFNLNRIPINSIASKLRRIANQLDVTIEDDAINLLAQRAEGGLRDAESLFDQILAFQDGTVTRDSVMSVLGITPRETYFAIDEAGEKGEFYLAYEIADRIFSAGKDPLIFIEGFIYHLRQILLIQLSPNSPLLSPMTSEEKTAYVQTAQFYTQEQCMDLIEYLLQAQEKMRHCHFNKLYLESIISHIMRSHFRVPIEYLVRRLNEMEETIASSPILDPTTPIKAPMQSEPAEVVVKQIPTPAPILAPLPKVTSVPITSISEDPTPTARELGLKPVKEPKPILEPKKPLDEVESKPSKRPLHEYDTLMHFAAVELEGKLQKNAYLQI